MKDNKRFLYETRPLALEENAVSARNYRFTILTPSLIRMEYTRTGIFENSTQHTSCSRHRMFPYIYTMNYRNYAEQVMICGDELITNNGDIESRCETILRLKEQLILTDESHYN